jgi:hypothetical protein
LPRLLAPFTPKLSFGVFCYGVPTCPDDFYRDVFDRDEFLRGDLRALPVSRSP